MLLCSPLNPAFPLSKTINCIDLSKNLFLPSPCQQATECSSFVTGLLSSRQTANAAVSITSKLSYIEIEIKRVKKESCGAGERRWRCTYSVSLTKCKQFLTSPTPNISVFSSQGSNRNTGFISSILINKIQLPVYLR